MSLGRLMIIMASKGQRLTHIPQPMHSVSEMKQMVEVGFTSTQILPVLLRGHVLAHSCLHFLGLHLSGLIMAILSLLSIVNIYLYEVLFYRRGKDGKLIMITINTPII
jgi:hypothetical protein